MGRGSAEWGGGNKRAAWTRADHIEKWLAGVTGTSVATMANFTMRRLSTLGSGDSDSILGAHMNVSLEGGPCRRARGTHSTFTDLCRSKSARVDEPGSGFFTFLIT